MATYTANITADGNTYICDIVKPRYADKWEGNIAFIGDFGGGTATLGISYDNGSTIVPDLTFSATTATVESLILTGGRSDGNTVKLYVTMTGATAPDTNVTVTDNR